ncbi:MAG: hypothetical protein GWN77_03080, partial [Gammaproteobacteria bacterium]|nr:hypothetical protein [Gammaproteobacteria bacterium]
YYDYNGKFKAQIRLADGTQVEVSSAVFDPGPWHYLTMVVDDVNKNLHLYVDGQEVSASPVSYSGALADHEDAPYYIGTSEPLTELYEYRFKGLIDEAWIFSQSLTATEVEALFAGFSNYLVAVTAATVQVSANPTMIIANQVATATVTAMIRDDSEMPLSDGRVVQFTTDKGSLANGGLTTISGGQGEATIVLTSDTTSGLTEITATVDSISGSTTVEMLSPTPLLSVSVTAGQTMIAMGAMVTYSYEVANGGDVALSQVTIVDDNGSPDNPGDDIMIAACNDVTLVIGEAKECGTRTATLNQTTVNTVKATGKDLINNTVTATDSITIMVIPDIKIFLPLILKE